MGDENKKPDAPSEPQSGFPQKKIVYAVLVVAVVILAVVLIAKFGYNTDLLNPAGGQMSLVQRQTSAVRQQPLFAALQVQSQPFPQGADGQVLRPRPGTS